jgi:hypothetical protein
VKRVWHFIAVKSWTVDTPTQFIHTIKRKQLTLFTMAQHDKITQQPQLLNDENIAPNPGNSTAVTKGSNGEETTETGNTKAKENNGHKRKAASTARNLSPPNKKARHEGIGAATAFHPPVSDELNRVLREAEELANASARRRNGLPDQSSSGTTSVHYLTEEKRAHQVSLSTTRADTSQTQPFSRAPATLLVSTTAINLPTQEAAGDSFNTWNWAAFDDGDSDLLDTPDFIPTYDVNQEEEKTTETSTNPDGSDAKQPDHGQHPDHGALPKLPSWALKTLPPANTTADTHEVIAPLPSAYRTGRRARQGVTGLEKLANGLIVDRGSGPNLGPADYEPTLHETASQGLNRIIEEAVAAPRQPLPHVLAPLPNGRHPLPTVPVKKDGKDDGKKKEDE